MKYIQKIPTHWLVIASAWGSRVSSIIAQLFAIRIIITLLDQNHYAVFVLLSALMNWVIYMLDMGVSSQLQNTISARRAKNEPYCDLIKIAAWTTAGIALISILFYFASAPFFSRLYLREYLPFLQHKESQLLFHTELLFIGVGLGNMVYRIWYAENKGWKSNIFLAVGWVMGLPMVLIIQACLPAYTLNTILLAYYLPLSLMGWVQFAFVFYRSSKFSFNVTLSDIYLLLKSSFGFWLYIILSAFSLQIDYFIISQTLNETATIQYFLIAKILSAIYFLSTSLFSALWPVCAEAAALKEWYKLIQLHKRYTVISITITIICIAGFIIIRQPISELLAPGKQITLPILMIATMGIAFLIRIWGDTYATMLLSLNQIRRLWVTLAVQACLSVCFQWFGAVHYGVLGMIGGLILSLLLTSGWSMPFAFYRFIQQKQKEEYITGN